MTISVRPLPHMQLRQLALFCQLFWLLWSIRNSSSSWLAESLCDAGSWCKTLICHRHSNCRCSRHSSCAQAHGARATVMIATVLLQNTAQLFSAAFQLPVPNLGTFTRYWSLHVHDDGNVTIIVVVRTHVWLRFFYCKFSIATLT